MGRKIYKYLGIGLSTVCIVTTVGCSADKRPGDESSDTIFESAGAVESEDETTEIVTTEASSAEMVTMEIETEPDYDMPFDSEYRITQIRKNGIEEGKKYTIIDEFEYDSEGYLAEWKEVFNSENSTDFEEILYPYDEADDNVTIENGHITSVVSKNDNGDIICTEYYTYYDYNEYPIYFQYLDGNSNTYGYVRLNGDGTEECFRGYEIEDGIIKSFRSTVTDDKRNTVYSYDESGRLISADSHVEYAPDNIFDYSYIIVYKDDNHYDVMRVEGDNETKYASVSIEPDVTVVITFDVSGKPKNINKYNPDRSLACNETYNQNGTLNSGYYYLYDDRNRVSYKGIYSEDTGAMKDYEYTYIDDENGDAIMLQVTSENYVMLQVCIKDTLSDNNFGGPSYEVCTDNPKIIYYSNGMLKSYVDGDTTLEVSYEKIK